MEEVIKYNSSGLLDIKGLTDNFKAALELASVIGIEGNNAKIAADRLLTKTHGVSPLTLMNVDLLVADTYYTPTEIGEQLTPQIGPVAVNSRLEALGFQTKDSSKKRIKWNVTENGKPFCQEFNTGIKHKDGTPEIRLKWNGKIVKLLST